MIVSRLNKLNLLAASILLGLTFYYRLSPAGKFCSCDHCGLYVKQDSFVMRPFLAEDGDVFANLIYVSMIFVTISIVAALILGVSAYMAFK